MTNADCIVEKGTCVIHFLKPEVWRIYLRTQECHEVSFGSVSGGVVIINWQAHLLSH